MHLRVIVLALAGAASVPLLAQAQSSAQSAPTASPAPAKSQTVKKVVCRRVDDEETTGSRVGSAPKVCKTIEVPAPASESTGAPRPERGSR